MICSGVRYVTASAYASKLVSCPASVGSVLRTSAAVICAQAAACRSTAFVRTALTGKTCMLAVAWYRFLKYTFLLCVCIHKIDFKN